METLAKVLESLPKKTLALALALLFTGAVAWAGWHMRSDAQQDEQIGELTKNVTVLVEAMRQNETLRGEQRQEIKEWRDEMLAQIKENRAVLSKLNRRLDRKPLQ